MRHLLFTALFGISLSLSAQKFRPYHAFGIEANVNSTLLHTQHSTEPFVQNAGPDLNDGSIRFDVFGAYDYGILKWLGAGTGLGLSMRGGATVPYTRPNDKRRRDLFYLNVPVKLQLKPWNFFWLEPGVEIKYLLGHKDVGYPPNLPGGPFDAEQLNSFDVNWLAAMRFNLYRGLSINLGWHVGFSPLAEAILRYPENQQVYAQTNYTDWGIRFGVRYMFNEPD